MSETRHKETGNRQEIGESLFKPIFEAMDTTSAETVLREFKSVVDSIGITIFPSLGDLSRSCARSTYHTLG